MSSPRFEASDDRAVEVLQQYRQWGYNQWLANKGKGHKFRMIGNVIVEIFHPDSGGGYVRFVTIFTGGFAFHPRSLKYKGGVDTKSWNEQEKKYEKELPDDYLYPLVDDDNGTMILSVEKNNDDETVAIVDKTPNVQNYGVISWSNGEVTYSWKALPGICLSRPREEEIPPLTKVDMVSTSGNKYTPLDNYYYSDGTKAQDQSPGDIRGMAKIESGRMVMIVQHNYTQYDISGFGSPNINPDGQKWLRDNPGQSIPDNQKAGKYGGFYDELWVDGFASYTDPTTKKKRKVLINGEEIEETDGWMLIGYRVSPISNLPVWFAEDGMSAKEANTNDGFWQGGEWRWSYTPASQGSMAQYTGTFTKLDKPEDQEVTYYPLPKWKVQGTCSWQIMQMLKLSASMTYEIEDYTTSSGTAGAWETKKVPVVFQRRPDPTNQYIDVSSIGTPRTLTFAGYKALPIQWSGVDSQTDDGSVAYWDPTGKCVGNITATDNCGFTASVKLRGSLGGWKHVKTVDYRGGNPVGADWTTTEYTGETTRIDYSWKTVSWQTGDGGQFVYNCNGGPCGKTSSVWCSGSCDGYSGGSCSSCSNYDPPSYVGRIDNIQSFSPACACAYNTGAGLLYYNEYEWGC